jgi:hypothetical protein
VNAKEEFLAFNFLLQYKYMQWYINSMNEAAFYIKTICTDAQRDLVRQHYLPILPTRSAQNVLS